MKDITWALVTEYGGPFNGPSGKLLAESLERVGLNPDQAYITSVVMDRTSDGREDSLAAELASLPNLQCTLLLGNAPLKVITGHGGITTKRGLVTDPTPNFVGEKFFATLHPSAIGRAPKLESSWLEDLSDFAQLVNSVEETFTYTIVDSMRTMQEFKDAHKTKGALDIETTIADIYTEDTTLVSVAVTFDGKHAFVFRHDKWLGFAEKFFYDTKWIMHNGAFDTTVLRKKLGWDIEVEHDTMAMAFLINEEESKSLEHLSRVYLQLPKYKDVDYANILDEPFEKVAAMNGRDTVRTFNLYRPLADKLNEFPDRVRLYSWLLMPAVRTLVKVTDNGVPVDTEALETLRGEVSERRNELLSTLVAETPQPQPEVYPDGFPTKRKADPPEFNPSSPKQVGHILFDVFGLEPVGLTETGAPQTGKDSLIQLMLDAPDHVADWISTLLEFRDYNKQLTAYMDSWPALIGPDNKMHPRYKPLFVKTGRLSSELPNIQQVPRKKSYRSIFRAPDGYKWLKADYSQIELRLAAWIAQEEMMLGAYYADEDLHTLTAMNVLGDASARQVGKTLNFGLLYGAGPGTLQRIARMDYGVHMSLTDARKYSNKFFKAYPSLHQWHQQAEWEIGATGQAVSKLGRVRHLPESQSFDDGVRWHAIRQGINHPVQSLASDMLLMALTRVHEQIAEYDAEIVCEVHDEMDLVVRDEHVEPVSEIVRSTMEDVSWTERWGFTIDVPIVAEVGVGQTWGDVG